MKAQPPGGAQLCSLRRFSRSLFLLRALRLYNGPAKRLIPKSFLKELALVQTELHPKIAYVEQHAVHGE